MYKNFTAETCTGTGLTMTLTGALAKRAAFGETGNFVDGSLVSYVIEDADGTIIVAGVGVYNSGANSITRSDTYNLTGSGVDNNPSSNVTLSGGTHTIRCDYSSQYGSSFSPRASRNTTGISSILGMSANVIFGGFTADKMYFTPFPVFSRGTYTEVGTEVGSAGAGDVRVGLYTNGFDGLPDRLIVDSGAMSVSSTVFISNSVSEFEVIPGLYWAAMVSDVNFGVSSGTEFALLTGGYELNSNPGSPLAFMRVDFTFGAMPAQAPTGTATLSTIRPLFSYYQV